MAVLKQPELYHGIDETTIEEWRREELEFFARLGEEDDEDIHRIAYVEALQRLQELGKKRSQSNVRFLAYDPQDGEYDCNAAKTRKLEAERRHANEQYERVALEVCEFEIKLGLGCRWTPLTPKYQESLKYLRERTYTKALLKLQRLVVQRLFELHKLNVAQTSRWSFHSCYQSSLLLSMQVTRCGRL